MKKAVYTIAKNEAANVEGFMKSLAGAPAYVLDTGSTDNTVELLKQHGANVKCVKIFPWRFDLARNQALDLVPSDIDVCVSIDMDERLDTGWQEKLDAEWSGNIGNYHYIATWRDAERTVPGIRSPRTRIHSRHGFEWHRKIHEVIRPLSNIQQQWCQTSILVKHYQNSEQRNYAPALKELLQENPNDADSWLQLAGEYHQKLCFEDSIYAYKQYLRIVENDITPSLRYRRAIAWLGVAQCLHKLDKTDETLRALLSAVAAEPCCREAWTQIAHVSQQLGNAPLAYGAAMTAYNIKTLPYPATTDAAFWGELPKQIADHAFGVIMKTGDK